MDCKDDNTDSIFSHSKALTTKSCFWGIHRLDRKNVVLTINRKWQFILNAPPPLKGIVQSNLYVVKQK